MKSVALKNSLTVEKSFGYGFAMNCKNLKIGVEFYFKELPLGKVLPPQVFRYYHKKVKKIHNAKYNFVVEYEGGHLDFFSMTGK